MSIKPSDASDFNYHDDNATDFDSHMDWWFSSEEYTCSNLVEVGSREGGLRVGDHLESATVTTSQLVDSHKRPLAEPTLSPGWGDHKWTTSAKPCQADSSQTQPLAEPFTHSVGLHGLAGEVTHPTAGVPSVWPIQGSTPLGLITPEHYALYCIKVYDVVRATGVPNYLGAQIPLLHGLKIDVWRRLLNDFNYHDVLLCDLLEFGFPLGIDRSDSHWLIPSTDNHPSALFNVHALRDYLITETELLALVGPFDCPPFHPFMISPMMLREKDRSAQTFRTIVDLSWPPGASVNACIPKDTYLGEPYKVSLPTVDDLIQQILQAGQGCYVYIRDLSRAYRQLRICPLDYPLLGLTHNGQFWFDTGVAFGARSGALFCQRWTDAIVFIMSQKGYVCSNYLDDLRGLSLDYDDACAGYYCLGALLSLLGVEESYHKRQPPTQTPRCMGLDFDTVQLTVAVPQDKLVAIRSLVQDWLLRSKATKRQLQSVLGKLLYIAKCVQPARLFLGKMLATLRRAPDQGTVDLDPEFRRDLVWFHKFLPHYNGVSLMTLPDLPSDLSTYFDASPTGCGGISGKYYYHAVFPQSVSAQELHMSQLEILNIMVGCKVFKELWHQHRIVIHCDNSSAIHLLQTGRCQDAKMLQVARQIWWLAAKHEFVLVARHRPSALMTEVDALSRLHTKASFSQKCHTTIADPNSIKLEVKDTDFECLVEI